MNWFSAAYFSTTVCIGIMLAAQAVAGDACFEIARNGPNIPHERGSCGKVGLSNEEEAKKPLDGLRQCKNGEGKVVEEANFKEGVCFRIGFSYSYTETGALSEELNFDEEGNLDGVGLQIDEKRKRTEAVYRK